MTDCVYCGCAVTAHDPVYVTRRPPEKHPTDADASDTASRETPETDAYCNYGCLAAHIDDAELAVGTACRVDV